MRFETLVPMSVPHRAVCDTTLAGYEIPKNTIVMANLMALHNDEDIWGDPKKFRPERFLDTNGKLDLKKDFSLPFGAGRRICAGETFARNTMFLCITALLQNFTLNASQALPKLIVDWRECQKIFGLNLKRDKKKVAILCGNNLFLSFYLFFHFPKPPLQLGLGSKVYPGVNSSGALASIDSAWTKFS